MRVFTVNDKQDLIQYEETDFSESNIEADLEILLERNPEYFFDGEKILVIGQQVTTNLGSIIDLLGLDKSGNTVVIELKRERTPRDTIAQLLEYASFVDSLDYSQLNDIFCRYCSDEIELQDYFDHYYESSDSENVSYNKQSRLVIVAQKITLQIRQTALYLRRKGIDVYCVEFRYFKTPGGEKIITSDFVVGADDILKGNVESAKQTTISREQFIGAITENGRGVFSRIFEFADEKGLLYRWGTKGFSLNVPFDVKFVGLFYGYPPDSVFKQTIYTGFESIANKVENASDIIAQYRMELDKIGYFVPAKSNLKWVIDRSYTEEEIGSFLSILDKVIEMIKENGLKE